MNEQAQDYRKQEDTDNRKTATAIYTTGDKIKLLSLRHETIKINGREQI